MNRTQPKSNKKPWTGDEDAALIALVEEHGSCGSWPTIALHMESRSGKQCRERYINQLDPRIKKTMWTYDEDAIIMRLHSQYGKKWSKFMDQLPGRSDNAIKNRFHIISRDNYSDHYRQNSQQKPPSGDEEEVDSDGQSDSPEADDDLLNSLLVKRNALDMQIEALVQKQKRPRTVSVDEVNSCNASFHTPEHPDENLNDAAEHLNSLRKSVQHQIDSLDWHLKTVSGDDDTVIKNEPPSDAQKVSNKELSSETNIKTELVYSNT